jgi:SAM-dependent methyltransferase
VTFPLEDILRCPRCRGPIEPEPLRCAEPSCAYHQTGFPRAGGQPVLIDFDDSVIARETFEAGPGVVYERGHKQSRIGWALDRLIQGRSRVSAEKIGRFVGLLPPDGRVLAVGGGSRGGGTESLYGSQLTVIGTDVYASPETAVVSDGHALPFADASFDGVLIQAVLEHVLEPARVVAEIHRVLKPDGLVYAETPFMQQVHEAAYDFTRFTLSGHRWLFRRFEEVEAGPTATSGVALLWAITFFFRSLGASPRVRTVLTAPFFWVRLLERFARTGPAQDAASGFYFIGRRSESSLSPRDMPGYYDAKQKG